MSYAVTAAVRTSYKSTLYYIYILYYLVVDHLSDVSKGQAFECFHCHKQAYGNSL